MSRSLLLGLALGLTPALFTAACAADPAAEAAVKPAYWPFTTIEAARFDEPWAMAFLPDGSLLVTEKAGKLVHFDPASGKRTEIAGVPQVAYGGQGGFGDVALHPRFADNGLVYYSYAEEGEGDTRGAAVARAKLLLDADGSGKLVDAQVIWRQTPKVSGNGHFSHRLVIHDGHLYVSSGDRQKMDPAQEFDTTLGKILRLTLDGQPAEGNPFAGEDSPLAGQIWSYGHRNPLGLEFDSTGRLWSSEMGPQGGDELNEILAGHNYGWPEASNGSHYDGTDIPDHAAGDGFKAPLVSWTPSVSPGSLLIYQGSMFPAWRDDAFLGALSGEALIRVDLSSGEQEKWPMGARIRAVEEAPDGSIWLLEDGAAGRLLELRIAG